MNIDVYQQDAMSYRLNTASQTYALLNLAAEAGEVVGAAAKYIRDGGMSKEEFSNTIKKELGDVMWMVAAVASDLSLSLSEICQHNLDKLEARQKNNTIKGSGDNR